MKRLSRIGVDRRALALQASQLAEHLERQYRDREVYWRTRARSRFGILPSGGVDISIIIDSMDRSKYKYPRTSVLQAKELQDFRRPAMDVTGVIVHGHMVMLALGEPVLAKDSSWMLSH